MTLGDILIRKQLISPQELEEYRSKQSQKRKHLEAILLEEAEISDKQLKEAKQEQYWRENGFWVI